MGRISRVLEESQTGSSDKKPIMEFKDPKASPSQGTEFVIPNSKIFADG